MPFEPYTFYVIASYVLAISGLLGLLGWAWTSHQKAVREHS